GTAIALEKGRSRCSKVWERECCFPYAEIPRVGTRKARTTPAIVACTPEFRTSVQVSSASGGSSTHAVQECFLNQASGWLVSHQNAAIGTSARARIPSRRSEV